MRIKHHFNMIEILLALGVCVIGVCSIMVLFPIGANASRDAALETYAANAADQVLHLLKYNLTVNDGTWSSLITGGGIGTAKPANQDFTLEQLNEEDTWGGYNDADEWVKELGGTVYQHKDHQNFFQIITHRNPADKKLGEFDLDKIDFRALMVVWKENIIIDPDDEDTKILYNYAVKLNIEISWPAELPATARQKAYYSLELFRPN